MSRDLDTRARAAANALREAVDDAELTSRPPVTAKRSRPLIVALRPAIILTLLLVGAAVGVALVSDNSPSATTAPTTTSPAGTTLAGVIPVAPDAEPAPPTTAYSPPSSQPASAPEPTEPATTLPADVEPPHLEVISPEDGAELETKTVTFAGITEPGAEVFSGRWEADVEPSGEWHIVLILRQGSNLVRFTARDNAGNESDASITVYYVPSEPTTTTTVAEEPVDFSAHFSFGSCSESPPWDVYYGTAEPGTLIEISSEYGSAVAETDAEGNWEKRVEFETPPPNTPFVVTISDEFGHSEAFEFIYEPE